MKRRFCLFLILLAVFLSASSCVGEAERTDETEPATEESTVVLPGSVESEEPKDPPPPAQPELPPDTGWSKIY